MKIEIKFEGDKHWASWQQDLFEHYVIKHGIVEKIQISACEILQNAIEDMVQEWGQNWYRDATAE